jgi:hypothetical protein
MEHLLGRRWGLAVSLVTTVVVALSTVPAASARGNDGPMSFLDNGKVRVGVNLLDGGKITYLSRLRGADAHDVVQDVQQSYYGGPPDSSWHVAASGGVVLVNRNDGHSIYTKVIPQQDYPYGECECTFETWITIQGNAVHVRNRLTNLRDDGPSFTPHGQELPALYTTGDAYRLYTYDGDAPYTGAPMREITDDRGGFFAPGGPSFRATEHWAALVNDDGFGVGLFEPRRTRFGGIPGNDYAVNYGWINGYMNSSTTDILSAKTVYTYDYTLVLGSLDEIRGYAVVHRPDPRPVYLFQKDRQHWWELNASDGGDPIRGALRLSPDRYDPQLYGPETSFAASSVRAIYIRGAWHTEQSRAQLFWANADGFSGDRLMSFDVVNDGRFRTYRVPVGELSTWTGTIDGLRLDFVDDQPEPGRWVDISCISWKPCPRRPAQERRLSRSVPPAIFLDSFDSSFDPSFWLSATQSPGTSAAVAGGRLVLTVGADAEPSPGDTFVAAGIASRCKVAGDYDLRVDYRLLEWPAANGVDLVFGTDYVHNIGRLNTPTDSYYAFPPTGNSAPTNDRSGSLRLTRSGDTLEGFYLHAGQWIPLWEAPVTRSSALVQLSAVANPGTFAGQEVTVAFDNFRVIRGRVACS